MSDEIRLIHGDCLDEMAKLDPASVDAIVMDPPYGTEEERDGYGRRQKWDGDQKIAGDTDLGILIAALPECRRLVKPNGWVVMFCSPKRRDEVGEVCREAGLRIRGEVVWDKRAPGLGGGIRYQHETILLGSFGKPVGRHGMASVHSEWVPKGQNGHREQRHVHEKPLGLMASLIRYVSREGETVLDPFAGSCSTLVAAMKSGRKAIGIEIDERYIEPARRRLRNAETPLFSEGFV